MGKIAVDLERALARRAAAGGPGTMAGRVLAQGDGWAVEDVLCTSGPGDRPFEERHSHVAIAIVAAGSFQYRSPAGRVLMTPGSLLLGNAGQCFECGHDHGSGDRCLAFRYSPEYFESVVSDVGGSRSLVFPVLRLPPLRGLATLVARASAGLAESVEVSWEELGIQLAAQTVRSARGFGSESAAMPPSAESRVTKAVRLIERHGGMGLGLGALAREAGLSPYHFLRTFERLTGLTPHQYVLRMRLREAAVRLSAEPTKVIDIALGCGFGDVSNFNRAFRAEFGVTPLGYRRRQ